MSFLKNLAMIKFGGGAPATRPTGPLGLALGRAVTIDKGPFTMLKGLSSVSHPGNVRGVVAHGRIELGNAVYHRYYLDVEGGGGFLQVGETEECRYFKPFSNEYVHDGVVYPPTVEDWQTYLDDGWRVQTDAAGNTVYDAAGDPAKVRLTERGLIGYEPFNLYGTEYRRVWSPQPRDANDQTVGECWVKPFEFAETITFANGAVTVQRHQAMLYARYLVGAFKDTWEYFLISAVNEGDEWRVDWHLGLDLDRHIVTGA